MNDEKNDQNSDVTPELVQKLQEIKDRCMPPAQISYRAFYVFLLAGSFLLYLAHKIVSDSVDWDSMRYPFGLLPFNVLMMRNAMVPWLLPIIVLIFFALSFKFKALRSPVFLAWFTLILFGLTVTYVWTSDMFAFHLLIRMKP